MELFQLHHPVALSEPVFLLGLTGWGDAAAAASDAVDWLVEDAQTIATFEPDAIFDYRSNRPILRFTAGEPLAVSWPRMEIVHTKPSGRDVLALVGNEPDFQWGAIAKALIEISERFDVSHVVTVGAVPTPVRHSMPTAVFGTSSDSRLLLPGDEMLMDEIVVPASAGSAFRAEFEGAGFSTVGYWAQVPQYVGRPYQPAMHALLVKISEQIGVDINLTEVESAAYDQIERLDEILEKRSDARDFVEGLDISVGTTSQIPTDLPTADEIADEFSKYLRGSNGDDEG
ncbi:MAG: PAC2 family protein [Armatimonadetes bacterium]|nr:MAG: PAC2 family protein [Armatimonadota bacterium]